MLPTKRSWCPRAVTGERDAVIEPLRRLGAATVPSRRAQQIRRHVAPVADQLRDAYGDSLNDPRTILELTMALAVEPVTTGHATESR